MSKKSIWHKDIWKSGRRSAYPDFSYKAKMKNKKYLNKTYIILDYIILKLLVH